MNILYQNNIVNNFRLIFNLFHLLLSEYVIESTHTVVREVKPFMEIIWSKEVFAENLKRYMEAKGISQKELSEIVGVSATSVNEWIKAKKYPRIDKIEIMANYFNILKSDLIEDKKDQSVEREKMQKKNDTLTDIVLRMRTDPSFLFIVESLHSRDDSEILDLMKTLLSLDDEKIRSVKQMLSAFLK